jgi:alkylhydroperoxidase family enzyme
MEDTMALRVPKAEPSGLSESMIEQFGAVLEPVEVIWHNPKVAEAAVQFGVKVSQWDAADESLKSFADVAVAAQVGCSWCLDFGYFQAQNQNLDMAKASQVPRWRESDVFTPPERDVLEYAEAMTNTPPTGLLSTVAYEMLGSAADAEDAVQETWLRWAEMGDAAATRCATHAPTWSGWSHGRRSTGCARLSGSASTTSASGCPRRC